MTLARANAVGGSDYTSGSLREDLANFITLVSPEKTPHLSMISTNKASNPRHEWQVDTLVDPADNAQDSGFAFSATATSPVDTPDRVANIAQVFGKQVDIDGPTMKSNPAGAKNWFEYATNKRKIEIRRDIERQQLKYYENEGSSNANAVAMVYNSGNSAHMAGLAAYAGTITNAGSTALQTVTGTAAGTAIANSASATFSRISNTTNFGASCVTADGTSATNKAAVSIANINATLQAVSEAGGMVNTAQIPTGMKATVSSLLVNGTGTGSSAQRRADQMASKLNLAIDTVVTEFGFTVDLVSNYIMENHAQDADHSIYFYDSSKVKRSMLAPFEMEVDGTARVGKAAILSCIETMEVADPASVAVMINLS